MVEILEKSVIHQVVPEGFTLVDIHTQLYSQNRRLSLQLLHEVADSNSQATSPATSRVR